MFVEHVLDLHRVDILAAGDEHILLAVVDVEIPLIVIFNDVARVEPAVLVEHRSRGVRDCSSNRNSPKVP